MHTLNSLLHTPWPAIGAQSAALLTITAVLARKLRESKRLAAVIVSRRP